MLTRKQAILAQQWMMRYEQPPTISQMMSNTPSNALDLAEIDAHIAAANKKLERLCDGERFNMSIPARPDEDADLIFARVFGDASRLLARVRELESERDALRNFVNAEREKTLARFRAGCLVCGAMAWKITTNGNMQCGQCANIFDAPIVAAPTIDAERAE